jgi:trehalose 6-phosphate synthase/phosphatase
MIKKEIPNAYIGLFMHAPFPSSEYFRCLPSIFPIYLLNNVERKEVLLGMLGSNMIGFQNYSYSRHFVSSCIRVLGFESTKSGVDAHGARVAIEAFPIGIDVTRVEKELANPSTLSQMKAIREIYAGKKIIVGRDRLDEVRGVLQKLRVFEMFLEQYPDWRGRVVLIQVTSEAQHHAPKLEKKVADMISFINGKYGSLEFTPVHHYHHQLDPDQYFALLRVADLGLITSVRDGMNTMGLEYVVCQKGHNGPVILSEFTGTAGSLTDAIHVNPWDAAGVAKAINYALSMSPEDKEIRQRHLYKHVTTHTVQAWTSLFLKRLMENLNSGEQSQTTPQLDQNLLRERFDKSKKRLFMFDYDGTLTPIVKEPSAAVPSQKLLRTLRTLAADPHNAVWVISGRDQEFLEKHLGDIPGLGLSAEHGCFLREPNTAKDGWINLTENLDMSWQKDVLDIFEYYTERTIGNSSRPTLLMIGSKVERKRCALTWHYRNADPEFGLWQSRELQTHLEQAIIPKHSIEILTGKANLEVRPRDINKGEIVGRLVKEQAEDLDFVFCAGDDKTDEGKIMI